MQGIPFAVDSFVLIRYNEFVATGIASAVSPKKIAMYTSKIEDATINTIKNALRYVVSGIANALGGEAKKLLKGAF